MSADNTIAILASCADDGRPEYRVAHVQAVENATYDADPVSRDTYIWNEFAPCKVFRSYRKARNEACRLHDEVGFVEYGIVDINLGRAFGPGQADMHQVAAFRLGQVLRPVPSKPRPASRSRRRIRSLTRRVIRLEGQLAIADRTIEMVRSEKAAIVAEIEKVLASHR